MSLRGPKGRGNLLCDGQKKPSLSLRLLRGVYPEQSEGLAMTCGFCTEHYQLSVTIYQNPNLNKKKWLK